MVILVTACWLLGPNRAASAADPEPPTIAYCLKHSHSACLTPAQLQAYYGVDTLLKQGIRGQNTTIAVVDSFGSPTLRADLMLFDRAFGLPDPQLSIIAPLGNSQPSATGWAAETTLDVEWAHAFAPDAKIVVLVSPVDETEGVQGLPEFLKLEQYALRHHLADVISQSWGATEDTLLTPAGRQIVNSFHQFYAEAAAQGVSTVAGSGDDGAAGIDLSLKKLFPNPAVGYPASDPYVLAVGGTQLTVDSAGTVIDETGWSRSGGGVSKLFPEPAYQKGLSAEVQHMLAGHRGLPDVAADASSSSGLLIFVGGHWHTVGGTSAAAPLWAGILALADGLAHHGLGSVNPYLYELACSARTSSDLRDITTGGSLGPSQDGTKLAGPGFQAMVGWDAVTGLGSPRAATLVPALVQAAAHPIGSRANEVKDLYCKHRRNPAS
jgi:subtilase family serine protease